MRPLLTVVIAVLVFGSVKGYMLFQDSLPKPPVIQTFARQAEGSFSVEIVLTFDAAADAFSLEPTSALVQFHGEDLLRSQEPLPAGAPIVIEDVANVVAGKNSFYVKISAADDSFNSQHAVRLRVMRDGQPLAEHTIWSRPGEPVEGVIDVDVLGQQQTSDPHEH
jgi:hypothetical protein